MTVVAERTFHRPSAAPRLTTRSAAQGFAGLNGARAIAAYLVIATHVGFQTGRSLTDAPTAPFLARMEYGVTIFFLLSGFLLSRRFLTDSTKALSGPELKTFWWRRALRILPAYWVTIVIVLGVLSARHADGGDWASYLTLSQTYDHHTVDPSLSQTWTLSVELMFYIALPLLVLASRLVPARRQTRHLAMLVVMVAVALVGNLLAHRGTGRLNPQLEWMPLYLDWFALGILLASAHVDRESPAAWQRTVLRWAQSPGTCWVIGVLLFWFSTLPLCGPRDLTTATTWQWTIKHYLYGGSAFFLLLPLTLGAATWPDRLLGGRTMTVLGEISYGVYLWHLPLLVALQQRWFGFTIFNGHFWTLFVTTVAASTAVAAVSWYGFERPLLRRFSTSSRRSRSSPHRADQAQRHQAEHLGPRPAG